MKITAIAPWFGSKRTLAPKIVEALGPHRCYWEPFCGSMAALFEKSPVTMETVNDLHGDLINLARVVQSEGDAAWLYGQLQRTLCSQVQWQESAEYVRGQPFAPSPLRAFHYFVFSWLGRNGSAGANSGQNFCVRYTSKGGAPASRFRSAVESVPDWFERLRSVTILSEDAFEIINRLEDLDGTAIYCDPPYLVKGAKYVHDFTDDDHARLATLLARFRRTRVVVSYYAHPRLAALYPNWQLIDCPQTKALVNQGQRDAKGATVAPEVLIVNTPHAAAASLFQEAR